MRNSDKSKNMDKIEFLALEATKTYMSTRSSKYQKEYDFLNKFYEIYNMAKEIMYLEEEDKKKTRELGLTPRSYIPVEEVYGEVGEGH